MVSLGIPFWLYWGPYPALYTPQHSCIQSYAPAPHPTSDLNPKTNVPPPSGFPSIERGSGQLPGETWRAFFTRRKQDDEKRRARESDYERQQRENRERASNPAMGPGKQGAKVWYWEMVDGFRMRTLLTRRRVEDEWSVYSRVQKIFNGFRNEWDMCTEFGEDDLMKDIAMDSNSEPILPIGPSKSRKADSSQSSHLPPSQPLSSDAFSKQQDRSRNTIHPTPSESRNPALGAAIESDGSNSEPILPIGRPILQKANQPQSIHLPTCQPPSCDLPLHHVSLETASHHPRHHTPFESGSEAAPLDGDSDDDDVNELRNRLSESGRDVLYSAYSYRPLPATQCFFDDLAQLLYFRFGFNFGVGRYVVPPNAMLVFKQWYDVTCCVGGVAKTLRARSARNLPSLIFCHYSSLQRQMQSLLFRPNFGTYTQIIPSLWNPNSPGLWILSSSPSAMILLFVFSVDATCITAAMLLG